jgi:hypothetical protein
MPSIGLDKKSTGMLLPVSRGHAAAEHREHAAPHVELLGFDGPATADACRWIC